MKYIALDCHKTGETKTKKLAHVKEEFREFIGDKVGTRMVIESCRDWSRSYELSEDLVEDVILAYPLKVKDIASAKIKTDKIDSKILGN